jgi:hypothetical protein
LEALNDLLKGVASLFGEGVACGEFLQGGEMALGGSASQEL